MVGQRLATLTAEPYYTRQLPPLLLLTTSTTFPEEPQ